MAPGIIRWIAALAAGIAVASQTLAGPAEPFAKENEIDDVALSPDGDRIALSIRGAEGGATLAVVQIDGMKPLGKVAVARGRDVVDFYWNTDDRLLFGMAVHLGIGEASYFTRDLFAVNADGSGLKQLLGPQAAGSWRDWTMVDSQLKDDPDSVLLRLSDPDAPYSRAPAEFLYKLDTRQGRLRRLTQARSASGAFLVDNADRVRLQTATESDLTQLLLYRRIDSENWTEIGRFPFISRGSLRPLGFTTDDRKVYVLDNRGSPRHLDELFLIDPEHPEPERLLSDPVYDVSELLNSRTPGAPVGAVVYGERREWRFFDPKAPDAVLLASILDTFKGRDVRIVNWSKDRSRVAIFVDGDVDPGNYYVLDLAHARILTRLSARPWIDPAAMAPMMPIALKARDGLELHGYLTVPKDGSHHKLVVLPHGGPFGIRDRWQFDPEVQWLARNGYSVLQVNYRGSGGYGAIVRSSGRGQWGGKMQDDVTDATRWAIEHGHADADKVCIFGGSYGGYAALMGVVREPDLYRCAIGYSGVYDLNMIKRSGTRMTERFDDVMMGDDPEDLARRSPVHHAGEIKAAVLLIHGGEDPICPPDQFDAMKRALTSANKRVETLYKDKEGHGFTSAANREEAFERVVRFLDANTGGPANSH